MFPKGGICLLFALFSNGYDLCIGIEVASTTTLKWMLSICVMCRVLEACIFWYNHFFITKNCISNNKVNTTNKKWWFFFIRIGCIQRRVLIIIPLLFPLPNKPFFFKSHSRDSPIPYALRLSLFYLKYVNLFGMYI